MKVLRAVSWTALVAAVLVMGANALFLPLPDWAVRTDGAVMLLTLFLTGFTTFRGETGRRKEK